MPSPNVDPYDTYGRLHYNSYLYVYAKRLLSTLRNHTSDNSAYEGGTYCFEAK